MELTNKQITVIFKALCDENRVQIFRLLQNGEKCACKLLEAMQCTQPTLSHHTQALEPSPRNAGEKRLAAGGCLQGCTGKDRVSFLLTVRE